MGTNLYKTMSLASKIQSLGGLSTTIDKHNATISPASHRTLLTPAKGKLLPKIQLVKPQHFFRTISFRQLATLFSRSHKAQYRKQIQSKIDNARNAENKLVEFRKWFTNINAYKLSLKYPDILPERFKATKTRDRLTRSLIQAADHVFFAMRTIDSTYAELVRARAAWEKLAERLDSGVSFAEHEKDAREQILQQRESSTLDEEITIGSMAFQLIAHVNQLVEIGAIESDGEIIGEELKRWDGEVPYIRTMTDPFSKGGRGLHNSTHYAVTAKLRRLVEEIKDVDDQFVDVLTWMPSKDGESKLKEPNPDYFVDDWIIRTRRVSGPEDLEDLKFRLAIIIGEVLQATKLRENDRERNA